MKSIQLILAHYFSCKVSKVFSHLRIARIPVEPAVMFLDEFFLYIADVVFPSWKIHLAYPQRIDPCVNLHSKRVRGLDRKRQGVISGPFSRNIRKARRPLKNLGRIERVCVADNLEHHGVATRAFNGVDKADKILFLLLPLLGNPGLHFRRTFNRTVFLGLACQMDLHFRPVYAFNGRKPCSPEFKRNVDTVLFHVKSSRTVSKVLGKTKQEQTGNQKGNQRNNKLFHIAIK